MKHCSEQRIKSFTLIAWNIFQTEVFFSNSASLANCSWFGPMDNGQWPLSIANGSLAIPSSWELKRRGESLNTENGRRGNCQLFIANNTICVYFSTWIMWCCKYDSIKIITAYEKTLGKRAFQSLFLNPKHAGTSVELRRILNKDDVTNAVVVNTSSSNNNLISRNQSIRHDINVDNALTMTCCVFVMNNSSQLCFDLHWKPIRRVLCNNLHSTRC